MGRRLASLAQGENDCLCFSGWQGMISAAQYYKSCRDLLGESFQKIFSELLALLPDTAKQQELLSAHTDFCSREKPPNSRSKKNKKNVWQTWTAVCAPPASRYWHTVTSAATRHCTLPGTMTSPPFKPLPGSLRSCCW